MNFAEVRNNALDRARMWADQGDQFMAMHYLTQAHNAGYVSDQQDIAIVVRLMRFKKAEDGTMLALWHGVFHWNEQGFYRAESAVKLYKSAAWAHKFADKMDSDYVVRAVWSPLR